MSYGSDKLNKEAREIPAFRGALEYLETDDPSERRRRVDMLRLLAYEAERLPIPRQSAAC